MTMMVVMSDTLPLADVKQVARGCGASVNDVVMALVAGALREFLQFRRGVFRRRDNVNCFLRACESDVEEAQFLRAFLAFALRLARRGDRLHRLHRLCRLS